MNWLLHWLTVHTGSSNTSGSPKNYNFWSGIGSDMGEVALFGAVLGAYHKHNCHQRHCWRIGKHTVDGTPWCTKHQDAARQRQTGAQTPAPAPTTNGE
jgi:hypothetical protein